MNTLKHEIAITSKANTFRDHVVVGKTPINGHGIQNHSFDVFWSYMHLNPLECQQNWNVLPILHHVNIDVDPLLHIDSGDLICIVSNIISF